jgi:hypothetical protein
MGGDPSAHDDYYANDPRGIGEMVEKSKKKLFCDAKFGKKRVFLGDRFLKPNRARSTTNDLRTAQATPSKGLTDDQRPICGKIIEKLKQGSIYPAPR